MIWRDAEPGLRHRRDVAVVTGWTEACSRTRLGSESGVKSEGVLDLNPEAKENDASQGGNAMKIVL